LDRLLLLKLTFCGCILFASELEGGHAAHSLLDINHLERRWKLFELSNSLFSGLFFSSDVRKAFMAYDFLSLRRNFAFFINAPAIGVATGSISSVSSAGADGKAGPDLPEYDKIQRVFLVSMSNTRRNAGHRGRTMSNTLSI